MTKITLATFAQDFIFYIIEKGITKEADKKAIIRYILDLFNAKLIALAEKFDNVTFIDVRKTVRNDQWFDEIHPDAKL